VLVLSAAVYGAALHAAPETASAGCVGYEFNRIRDYGRSFSAGGRLQPYRDVHYGLWGPASRCSGARMTFAGYAQDAGVQAALPDAETGARSARFWSELISADRPLPDRVLATTTHARRVAPALPAGGNLVVYIHASAIEAHALAEDLAASGTLVAALTWRGTYRQEFDVAASGLVSEVLDAEAVVRDLGARGFAASRIVVVGTSFGALTALCWHGAEARMQAIVSLDGGIATPTAAKLMPSCPWPEVAETVAVLHLYDASYEGVTFDYLRSRSDVVFAALPIPLLLHRDYHATAFVRAAAAAGQDDGARVDAAQRMIGRASAFVRCALSGPAADCLGPAAAALSPAAP
jgi:dienelactone hydrolase